MSDTDNQLKQGADKVDVAIVAAETMNGDHGSHVVGDDEMPSPPKQWYLQALIRSWEFFNAYDFPILLLAFIGIAKLAPRFGAIHLAPQYSATWIAVALIFFLSAIGLKTEQFAYAFLRWRFNSFVLVNNFGFVSLVMFGVSRILKSAGILSPFLSDGLVLCGALPSTINAVGVLTVASHGDEAVAIFNEAVSNMIGVFLSPLLIRAYLGRTPGADLPTIFWKLIVRVLVPLVAGQLARSSSKKVAAFRDKYQGWFARAQKYLLVFIVYTVFCKTFLKKAGTGLGDVFALVLVLFVLQVLFLATSWGMTYVFYRDQPKLRVVGLFFPYAKTVALGIPLIQSLYEKNPRVGVYALPILIWYPMLLVVGSCLTPIVRKFVDSEVERLEGPAKQADPVDHDEESPTVVDVTESAEVDSDTDA